MDSLVLLQNNFYKNGSSILTQTLQQLTKKLNIQTDEIKTIQLGNKLLSLDESYYINLISLLTQVSKDGNKLIIYDSQSLIEIIKLFKKLYEDSDFKEDLEQSIKQSIDVISLENTIKFIPEIILQALNQNIDSINIGRWNGFKCGFIIDRELEGLIKELKILEQLELTTGLKILPFFSESYDYLLSTNEELAYKMASKIYYEMVDSGIDFIMSVNIGNFELFDTHALELKKATHRDDENIPVLFIPQVILALFKDSNKESLLFNKHKITPQML
ncbi:MULTISPECIES: HdrB C-terminal domain-containing protein [Helicobacter]|uniref:HdrB-like C-terminal domain-containing protein n=1 Tax=Helicobacter ibis TaxID=2962633 RepID=A0ABT4VG39_9HELI|nr:MULTISPECIES: hypothetical protein [Helicobacter]MDA3966419.1 hypothetical protein [Helicobacter sp. WB40]MDA3968966.1 hypothetical protein [Helicobacter ibis]